MRKRVRCPFHNERTASLVQTKTGWYCYGACQKSFTHKEVEEKTGSRIDYDYDDSDDEKEDIQAKLVYIRNLRPTEVRGLRLPADERGYFIVWGDNSYYKYRLYDPGKGSKYIGPKGHKPPLFWARRTLSPILYITEGEINALSLATAITDSSVCSLGSASCFKSDILKNYLTQFREYNRIIIVLDKDAAGTKALIEAKAFFLYKLPFVDFIQLEKDCNEILCEEGQEALRRALSGTNYR